MSFRIKELPGIHACNTDEELIRACNQSIIDFYPGLEVRWVRIFGNRWSYLFGNSEELSLDAKRIRLNDKYGIYIDNAGPLNPGEIDELTAGLKACFTKVSRGRGC